MQLLDSPINSSHLDTSQTRDLDDSALLMAELQDIVNNIRIESNFCIRHPNYKPLELPVEAISRFEQLSLDLQKKLLSLQLCNFLYGIYYNGSLRSALALDADPPNLAVQNLENNTLMGVDLAFYDRLHNSNHGDGYYSSDWSVVREEEDGSLAVAQNGLTLHIDQERHLQPSEQAVTIGDSVAIRLPRNLVQNGFYMAVGNAGSHAEQEIVRVYFNITPEGAVGLMGSLTQQLNPISLPFSFKALYNPSDYKRYDAAVLYFQKANYPRVQPILQAVYAEHRDCFRELVPLFTKCLAPGLAIAEEPNQRLAAQESFGTNRCQIVTNGLLEAWQQGNEAPEHRMDLIREHFALLGIDLQRPYLNENSEDIYSILDL